LVVGGVVVFEEGRLRVRDRRWSWFASRTWERDCGPMDWNLERKEEAMDVADAGERRGCEMENVRS
jgi:hypothetical protein